MSEENDNKIKGSGFGFWDSLIRGPIFAETGIDIKKGFETSAEESKETGSVGMLLGLLVDVFGSGCDNSFTTKELFLAIGDERNFSDTELQLAANIRKGVQEECGRLRDEMTMINARATASLKSTGWVVSSLKDRVSGNLIFVRHKTRSKTPIKHWIDVMSE